MAKRSTEVRSIIGENIRALRMKMFPGRGGSKTCAKAFGVSQQQWSPWEVGTRTPDGIRLEEMAEFFKVPVEYFYINHAAPNLRYAPGADVPAPAPPEGASCPHCRNPVPGQPSVGNLLSRCGIANRLSGNVHEITITVHFRDSDTINFILKECIGNLNSEK